MLTDTKIKALKPRKGPFRVADTNGLCIEVRPNGSKVWRYRYRHAGKASMATMSFYPALGLADARAERDRLRVLLKGGGNPSLLLSTERLIRANDSSTSFGGIANEWLDKREKEGLSPGSVRRERRLIDKDMAIIAKLPITDVSAPVLLAALRKLEKRGILESAHRARSLAARVFRYAIATGRANINPADSLLGALQQPKTKHLASLTDPEKIRDLLIAIHSYRGLAATSAALKLAPLLFVRPGELRHAKWADVDLEAGQWSFIASKTRTPHIVPLATQAQEILIELRPLTERSEYVFPGVRSGKRPMSENTINAALRALGYDGETMTGHGFRAMARTVMDEVLGIRPDFIEHQLAHAVRDPLGRAYNRTAHLQERAKMMQRWADYLDDLRLDRIAKNAA